MIFCGSGPTGQCFGLGLKLKDTGLLQFPIPPLVSNGVEPCRNGLQIVSFAASSLWIRMMNKKMDMRMRMAEQTFQ